MSRAVVVGLSRASSKHASKDDPLPWSEQVLFEVLVWSIRLS